MTRRTRLLIIISSAVILTGIVIGVFVWRSVNSEEAKLEQAISEQQAAIKEILDSNYQRVLFTSLQTPEPGETAVIDGTLRISDVNEATTATMTDNLSDHYSNLLTDSTTWFTVEGNTIYKHQPFVEPVAMGTTVNRVAEKTNQQMHDIAVNPSAEYISWISLVENKPSVVVHSTKSGEETIIFTSSTENEIRDLVWSPTGEELAFVQNRNTIITIDKNGAQFNNPIKLPYTDFNFIDWIEPEIIASVISSQSDNPEPFEPKIVLLDRDGQVAEQHKLKEKIGVPRVLWSDDNRNFLYYDAWHNQFLVYDRFDELKQIVKVQASGTQVPFGWLSGDSSLYQPSQQDIVDALNVNAPDVSSGGTFNVTSDEWEEYNNAVRSIMSQFKVNFDSYRFATSDTGIEVAANLRSGQNRPERVFIQILLQTIIMLPSVPELDLSITQDQTTWSVLDFTRAEAQAIADQLSTQPFDQLFVVNEEYPYGSPVHKLESPDHTYIGDLFYSSGGDYNPYAALAIMDATINENLFLRTEEFSLMYPNTWFTKDRALTVGVPYRTGDVIFYTDETTFVSESSWEGFAANIRSYDVPEISLDQWLFVNRNELTVEDVDFEVHQPLEIKKITYDDPGLNEYVIKVNNLVYVLQIQRTPEVTDADKAALKQMAETFSDYSVFYR